MSDEEADAEALPRLLRELVVEEAQRRGILGPRRVEGSPLETETFPQQRGYILDESRRITVCTPRRAAKTESHIRKLFRTTLMRPGAVAVYISMTRDNAKRNVWTRMQVMNARYGLGFVPNHNDLILRSRQTMSEIWITGLATSKEIAKLRGNRYDLVIVDEAQDILLPQEGFEDFLLSVIMPALGDRRGQLVVGGTPDPYRRNRWWYEARNSEAPRWQRWAKHSWLLTDNVYFKDPEGYLREIREEEGYSEDDPRYQAEYLGLWTFAKTNLCIDSYEPTRNDFWGDPKVKLPGYHYVMGLDPAHKDATAFVVEAYSSQKRHCVVVDSFAAPMVLDDAARVAESLMQKWPIEVIACDEGGIGKRIAEELLQRYRLPLVAAEKTDKRMRLAFMNSDLRTGRLQVCPAQNEGLIHQWNTVQWDPEHQREMEGQVCDLFDAAGYAHMACRAYWEEVASGTKPDPGEEYWAEQERKMAWKDSWGGDPGGDDGGA